MVNLKNAIVNKFSINIMFLNFCGLVNRFLYSGTKVVYATNSCNCKLHELVILCVLNFDHNFISLSSLYLSF